MIGWAIPHVEKPKIPSPFLQPPLLMLVHKIVRLTMDGGRVFKKGHVVFENLYLYSHCPLKISCLLHYGPEAYFLILSLQLTTVNP